MYFRAEGFSIFAIIDIFFLQIFLKSFISSGDCINDKAIQSTPSLIPAFAYFLSEGVNAEFFKIVSGKFIPLLLFKIPSKITLASIIFFEIFKTFNLILPSSINIGWLTLIFLKIFSSGNGISFCFKLFVLFVRKTFWPFLRRIELFF